MTYAEAIQFLYSLQLFGTRFGLERTFRLAELAGNPHERLRFIHVAGTNGKGSTCAMLESIYRKAGFKVGLFTSPHLVAFGERIQINRQPVSEDEITRLVSETKELLPQLPPNEHATFFEVVTVMALKYFAEQKCDLVIWETGMGGRLDSTNIVTPLASVITNVQFDHQAWLGDTLEKIAAEKAGIIKPRVPVITAVDNREAFRVVFETARKLDAPFWLITRTQTEFPPLAGIKLPLLGEHQLLNAAVAAYTVRALADEIAVPDDIIRSGLESVQWGGRLQLVERDGGKKILLDGAHNTAGAEVLRGALQTYFASEKLTLVLGALRDKDCGLICKILAPIANRILLTPVKSQRSAKPNELFAPCREANQQIEIRETDSLAHALKLADDDRFIVVAGSLYLIGEAMELLKLSAATPNNERNLNEWSGQPERTKN